MQMAPFVCVLIGAIDQLLSNAEESRTKAGSRNSLHALQLVFGAEAHRKRRSSALWIGFVVDWQCKEWEKARVRRGQGGQGTCSKIERNAISIGEVCCTLSAVSTPLQIGSRLA
jgi:hypothetical protein